VSSLLERFLENEPAPLDTTKASAPVAASLASFLAGKGPASSVLDSLCSIDHEKATEFTSLGPEHLPADAAARLGSLLRGIPDPERRATLQLAALRKYPAVASPCCLTTHCFGCATEGAHPGLSCVEVQLRRGAEAQEAVPYPGCGLQVRRTSPHEPFSK
jgi:hypothetical protein